MDGWLFVVNWDVDGWLLVNWDVNGWLLAVNWDVNGWLLAVNWGVDGWCLAVNLDVMGWLLVVNWDVMGWLVVMNWDVVEGLVNLFLMNRSRMVEARQTSEVRVCYSKGHKQGYDCKTTLKRRTRASCNLINTR